MSRELFKEIMDFLALPGGISKAAWDDTYLVMCHVTSPQDIFLYHAMSVLSRVARARKTRLPDPLHNMMVFNASGPQDSKDLGAVVRNRSNKKNVESYMKMVNKLSCPKKPQGN